MSAPYERAFVAQLETRLGADAPLIQVLVGPRQVGKTTGVRQLLARWSGSCHYANADDLLVYGQVAAQAGGADVGTQALQRLFHRIGRRILLIFNLYIDKYEQLFTYKLHYKLC